MPPVRPPRHLVRCFVRWIQLRQGAQLGNLEIYVSLRLRISVGLPCAPRFLIFSPKNRAKKLPVMAESANSNVGCFAVRTEHREPTPSVLVSMVSSGPFVTPLFFMVGGDSKSVQMGRSLSQRRGLSHMDSIAFCELNNFLDNVFSGIIHFSRRPIMP